MGRQRVRSTSRRANLREIETDGLLVDKEHGRKLTIGEINNKIFYVYKYRIAERTIRRFLKEGIDVDDWKEILVALGVREDQFDLYSTPSSEVTEQGRQVLAVDIEEATYFVAAWRGNPVHWPLAGHGAAGPDDPLRDLAVLWAKSKARERDRFLLLSAYAAWKMGEAGVEAYFERGDNGMLERLLSDTSWRGAAAHYLFGNLFTTRSVSGSDPTKHIQDAETAYKFWDRISPVGLESSLLLPGILSETNKIRNCSVWTPDSLDPMALEVPRPDRYLATIAIRLAYLSVLNQENERAARYLTRAGEHLGRVAVDPKSITYRSLNLRLCHSMVDLFEAYRKRSMDRHVLNQLQNVLGELKEDLDKGWQASEVSKVKFLEWMANVDFSEFALMKYLRKQKPHADMLFVNLRQAVTLREGRGTPVFRFDPNFQFPLKDDADLRSEFLRIIKPTAS